MDGKFFREGNCLVVDWGSKRKEVKYLGDSIWTKRKTTVSTLVCMDISRRNNSIFATHAYNKEASKPKESNTCWQNKISLYQWHQIWTQKFTNNFFITNEVWEHKFYIMERKVNSDMQRKKIYFLQIKIKTQRSSN